jgi:hypothetical protein
MKKVDEERVVWSGSVLGVSKRWRECTCGAFKKKRIREW